MNGKLASFRNLLLMPIGHLSGHRTGHMRDAFRYPHVPEWRGAPPVRRARTSRPNVHRSGLRRTSQGRSASAPPFRIANRARASRDGTQCAADSEKTVRQIKLSADGRWENNPDSAELHCGYGSVTHELGLEDNRPPTKTPSTPISAGWTPPNSSTGSSSFAIRRRGR